MTTLVISDTHLCDPFDVKKLNHLLKLFSQHDRIILNGDFWEGYWYTFDEFLNSKWSALFPILKQKHAIYIYGNHDRETYSDSRRDRFSDVSCWRHVEKIGATTYIFEHGNRLALKFDEKVHMQRVSSILFVPFYLVEMFIVRVLGLRFFHLLFGGLNRRIKKLLEQELKEGEIFVCGHTHCKEYAPESQFVNTGVNKYGYSEYGVIDETGAMTLYSTRYN
ncbi:MAG: metallophosphoesterase family protein [Candidatus Roizmanbacteria bacterium]